MVDTGRTKTKQNDMQILDINNDYFLFELEGKTVLTKTNPEGSEKYYTTLATCRNESVCGAHFQKKIEKLTDLDEETIIAKTIEYSLLNKKDDSYEDLISYSERMVNIIIDQKPLLFNDQFGDTRVYLCDNGIYKNMRLDSEEFKKYLVDQFYTCYDKVPKIDSVRDAIRTLSAISRNNETIKQFNRVATLQNEIGEKEIWIDLSDDLWRSIKITKKGSKSQKNFFICHF